MTRVSTVFCGVERSFARWIPAMFGHVKGGMWREQWADGDALQWHDSVPAVATLASRMAGFHNNMGH